MQHHEYNDQKTKATMSVYEKNFQTVSNKLLETKLEELETIQHIEKPEEVERVKTNIVQMEGTAHEQVMMGDTILLTNGGKEISRDVAIPILHEIEPCTPLSNMPEEYCDDFKQFSVEKVNNLNVNKKYLLFELYNFPFSVHIFISYIIIY